MNSIFYKDKYNNINELIKLSKNDNFSIFIEEYILLNIDRYITFLKDNLNINHNELLIIIDLTIYNKHNKVLFSKKDFDKHYNWYYKEFINMFMYNYYKNIKYLKKFIKIDKLSFYELVNHLNNKKRIYSYFENINNTNINFYLPIILNIEYPNS